MSSRTAHIQRKTSETDIDLILALTGTGESHIDTGIGFFDHMLTALARHGLFDLTVTCKATSKSMPTTPSKTSASASVKHYPTHWATKPASRDSALRTSPWTKPSPAPWSISLDARTSSITPHSPKNASAHFPHPGPRIFHRTRAQRPLKPAHRPHRGNNAHHGMEAIFKAVARSCDKPSPSQ